MVRKIEELDQQTDLDVLYFFKNIHEYTDNDLKVWLAKVEFRDIVIAMLAMSYMETKIMEELGDWNNNTEMIVLKKLCDENKNSDGDCKEVKDNNGDGRKTKCNKNDADFNQVKTDNKWYLNRLDFLVVPFINTCNKHVVDLIFYVFKRSGLNYFSVLFEAFKTKNELLIELHLLVARAMKKDTFDFSEIKKTLEITEKPKTGLDFFEDSLDTVSEEDTSSLVPHTSNNMIEIGGFVEQEGLKVRPFQVDRVVGLIDHLDKARELLLGLTVKSRVFYVENLSTYLSLHFDREICLLFVKQPRTIHFFKMLNKFENPPFFLYKGIDIKRMLLCETCRLFEIKKTRAKEWRGFGEKIAEFLDIHQRPKLNEPDLYKHELVCNAYTIKYFVEYCNRLFNQKEVDEQDLLCISAALPHFIRRYPHKGLLAILYKLIFIITATQCSNSVKENLIFNAPVYLEFLSKKPDNSFDFLAKNIDSSLISTSSSSHSFHAEIASEWAYSVSAITNDTSVSIPSASCIPSMDDCDDKIVSAFATPLIHNELDNKLATYFLDTYAHATNSISYNKTRIAFEKLMFVCADYTPFKFIYINSLFWLHTLGNCVGIVQKLKDIKDTSWRYRALLIINYKKLVELGVEPAWFKTTLSSDNSCFVRNLVARMMPVLERTYLV